MQNGLVELTPEQTQLVANILIFLETEVDFRKE